MDKQALAQQISQFVNRPVPNALQPAANLAQDVFNSQSPLVRLPVQVGQGVGERFAPWIKAPNSDPRNWSEMGARATGNITGTLALMVALQKLVGSKATPKSQGMPPHADVRPPHQAAIEQAMKAKDYTKVKQILDAIPAGDPYKASMESLFKSILP